MVTPFQKHVYNTYLYASRCNNNTPFTPRRDFDSLDKDKLNQLVLLENFLKKYPHLNIKLFFTAPYKIYKDTKYFDLSYFVKPIAIKTYHLYINQLDHQSPDHNDQLEHIIDSLNLIQQYCIDNKIKLNNYLTHSIKVTYSWCEHLLSNKVSIYAILGFSYNGYNIYSLLNSMPQDEKDLFFGKYNDNLSELLSNLHNSKKAKILIIKGLNKIDKKINEALTLEAG